MTLETTLLYTPDAFPREGYELSFSPTLDDSRLKTSLLYFPQILYVPFCANMMGVGFNLVTELAHTLVDQKIVEVLGPRVDEIRRIDQAYIYGRMQSLLIELNCAIPSRSFASSIDLDGTVGSSHNAVTTRVRRLLPCVHPSTPVSDILDFRESNSDQLARFWNHVQRLGDLISSISGEAEPNEKLIVSCVHELEDALERITDGLDSRGFGIGKIDFSFSNLLNATVSKGAEAALVAAFGLPALLATAVGKSISFSLKSGPQIQSSNHFPRQYEYIISALDMGLLHKSGGEEVDDWLNKQLNDSNNILTVAMPPAGTNPYLPKGGGFHNNIQA